MHGRREGEEQSKRLPRQHMWPPVGIDKDKSTTEKDLPFPAGSSPPFGSPSSHFFFKDGRKIGVGDCALFQSGDAPPFIGLIRWIRTQEQDAFAKLCVSWLYRPADVKLPKGVQLNSAPNEVFYSFHKDVISSASILHPCRVAFLKKGVEPPSGTPSFVCRRVYDIEHKCLWWLTDKDYINERQEEVDALLDRTRQEMHAAVQSGGRSPKPLNGPSSSQQQQQLKSGGSDSSQNLGTGTPSFASSQPKGKKRERSDQTAEPANKRELRDRSNPKSEDADPAGFKFDNLKAEVAKMTDKGGLSDTEAVDKLVSMIQLDRTERKLDFPTRVMLADVIANTNRDDCLDRFVQLRGVPVLDEWLQEAHKQGKNMGDSGNSPSPKEGDASNNSINKPVEDLLLALLRALDKLPVNLNALRNCNIGKSVNHLKNHKNLEIQKKARFLVDTWKKRVDAEMKINDGKLAGSGQPVAWQGKPSFLEVNRRTGSSEPVIRGPAAHLASSKSLPAKTMLNNPVTSSGQLKPHSPLSGAGAYKQTGGATGAGNSSSEPPAGAGEEKSTSSSQSQNNSQSCSSDHAKTLGGGSPWKEDARSSTAGSMYKNRQRRLVNGPPGAGPQKETINNAGAVKSGLPDRTSTVEKTSQSGVTSEKHGDTTPVSTPEHGNNTRLIVRLPNLGRSPGRSPARGTSAGAVSSEEPSPAVTDKHETNVTNNNDRKGNEVKEASVAAPDEGDRASAVIEDTDTGKGGLRTSCSSSGNEKGPAVVVKNSFSSMNALIESCVKYSEVSTPPQAGDDIGMNLLASVAAGEILKSEHGSPDVLPEEHCESDNNKGNVLEKDNAAPKSETSDGENNKMDLASLNENKVKMETNEKTPKSETNKDSDSVRKLDGPVKQNCDNQRDHAIVETNKDNWGDCKTTVRGRQANDDDKSNSSRAASEKTGEGNIATCGRSGQDRKESEKGPPCEEANNNNPVMKSDKSPETTKMEFPKDNNEVKDPSCITPRVESETKSGASELANHVSSAVKPESDVTGGREEPGSDTPTKLDFDLNEGIGLDDTSQCEPTTSAPAGPPIVHNIPSLSPFLPSSSGHPVNSPITVVAAPAKVPFEPPETLLQRPNKGETGWKGSAATSAFRPAEPRKVLEMQLGCASDTVRASSDKSSKQSRPLLEFDLNVADDRAIEEEVSQSSAQTTGSSARGFDLDLNRVDTDAVENNNSSLFLSNNYLSGSGQSRVEVPLMPLRPPSYNNNRHNNNNATEAANGLRDFDLNNGPALDEAGSEPISRGQIVRNASTNANMPFLHPVAGLRMNNSAAEVGSNNIASWFPPGNSYPAVAIPPFIPERSGEPPQPYSLIAAPSGAAQRIPLGGPHPFGGGQHVLSSSPAAMAFSPAAFPYAGFHYSPTFPLGSAANYADSSGMPSVFPTMPSQLGGPGGQAAVSSSHYLPPRPYLMTLPESSNTSGGSTGGSHDSRRWGRQAAGAGLDLNSGPGGADVDGKDEKGGPVIMRQILGGVGGMAPQAFADEQPRMFQMGGGKRKEPDGGWDSDASRSVHKQLSWH